MTRARAILHNRRKPSQTGYVIPGRQLRWLEFADHQRRDARHERIREFAALGYSQHKIAAEARCSVGHVNSVPRSENRRCELLNDCPPDFEPELYDDWRFTRNSDGIDHFGKTDPRIIDNLIWR